MTTFELKANVKKLLAKVIRLENPTVLTQEPTVAGLKKFFVFQNCVNNGSCCALKLNQFKIKRTKIDF